MRQLLFILIITSSFIPSVELMAQNRPTIDSWQDATIDGGLTLVAKVIKQDAETALVLAGFTALAYWAGYDMYAIRLKFSNNSNSTLYVYPNNFEVAEYNGGPGHSLDFFLIFRNGNIQNWSHVEMPPNTFIELYGYYFAPQGFDGNYLRTN